MSRLSDSSQPLRFVASLLQLFKHMVDNDQYHMTGRRLGERRADCRLLRRCARNMKILRERQT